MNDDRRRQKEHARAIAKQCIEQAKATMGVGWQHVSVDLQDALISHSILAVVNGQDESVSDAAVRRLSRDLVSEAFLLTSTMRRRA